MTARNVALISSLSLLVLVTACTSFYESPIETPIQPKLDVSAFQRVLIAGFVAGGTDDVDTNLETVRLLRSQLRSKSSLRVIEADVIPLTEVAAEGTGSEPASDQSKPSGGPGGAADGPRPQEVALPDKIRTEKDLEPYERVFANINFWKKLGEEYQNPLIVTGTVLFMPHSRSGFVTREQEVYDSFGRRRVLPVRTYTERKGFILRPKFVFIDGRTGTTLYSEAFREEILCNAQQNTPALSSYFELMDRLLPSFLSTLSTQKIRGTRVLLK
jgi:hypothetical protein